MVGRPSLSFRSTHRTSRRRASHGHAIHGLLQSQGADGALSPAKCTGGLTRYGGSQGARSATISQVPAYRRAKLLCVADPASSISSRAQVVEKPHAYSNSMGDPQLPRRIPRRAVATPLRCSVGSGWAFYSGVAGTRSRTGLDNALPSRRVVHAHYPRNAPPAPAGASSSAVSAVSAFGGRSLASRYRFDRRRRCPRGARGRHVARD